MNSDTITIPPKKSRKIKNAAVLAVVALCLLALLASGLGLLPLSDAGKTLLILLIAALLMVFEVLPLGLSALCVPVLLAFSGVLTVKEALSGFSNENVVLFGAMFIVGGALFRTGVAQRIGGSVVHLARGSRRRVLLYTMLVAALLSSVMSNTGTVAVLMPVCIGIAASMGMEKKYLLLPMAMMTSVGGLCTLVGTPPNLTVSSVLAESGYQSYGFLEFAYIGVPITVLTGAYFMLVMGKKLDGSASGFTPGEKTAAKFSSRQKLALAILLGVVILMATGAANLTLVAMVGAMLCVLLKIVSPTEAIDDIDWTTIFLFAGMLPLANALEKTGAGEQIAESIVALIGRAPSPTVLLTVVFWLSAVLTQFMSNTATAALLAPIALALAQSIGASPRAVLMIVSVSSSAAFLTPVATPPNTFVMGPSEAKFTDYLRLGAIPLVISYVLCVLLAPRIWPMF